MAETVINGTDILVFLDGTVVGHGTSHTLSMRMNTRATSNKDTGKFNTKAVGRLDVSASCDALIVYADASAMADTYLARLPVTIAFGQKTTGDNLDTTKFYAEGEFIITSMDINAADEANASYTVNFELHDDDFTLGLDNSLRVGVYATNTTGVLDNGFAAAFPKGGVAPYTFSWDTDPVVTTQSITGQAKGTYTVTVTDSTSVTPLVVSKSVVIQ